MGIKMVLLYNSILVIIVNTKYLISHWQNTVYSVKYPVIVMTKTAIPPYCIDCF